MSRQNVELVQRSIEQWVATGEPAWWTLHEECEIHDHDVMDAGEYRGHVGVTRWLEDWATAWSKFSMEIEEFIDAGEHVIAVVRIKATGRASGVPVERQDALLYTVQDGKITRLDYYNSKTQALDAVDLEEEAVSRPNVEVVRRIYELGAGQWSGREGGGRRSARDRAQELWDPELVVEENAAFPDRAIYRGYEGLARWWRSFYEVYDDLRIEPREFIPVGDAVVVHAHHWMRSKMGVTLERDITHVWTLRDGRAVHVTGYMDRAEALEAVGLKE